MTLVAAFLVGLRQANNISAMCRDVKEGRESPGKASAGARTVRGLPVQTETVELDEGPSPNPSGMPVSPKLARPATAFTSRQPHLLGVAGEGFMSFAAVGLAIFGHRSICPPFL
jgi:hypothetical protein